MNIKSLAHICIHSCDLEATLKFYCGPLGMQKQFDFTKHGRVIGFYLKASNNTYVEVFESAEARGRKSSSNLSHFCLETDSIEKLHQALIDAGYEPRPIKLGADKSYQFWITDPNGIDFEFHQYTPESAQFSHANVEVDW